MHQLLHHTIEFKRAMDAVGTFWTEHDVEQLAKVTEGAGKYVHLLRAKAKEDKYLRSKESAAIASIADPAFMIVPAHPQPIVAPAADIQTVDSFNPNLRVPGSPPTLGLVASENLRTAIETVDDRADNPASASKENAVSSTATGEPMRKKGGP